MAFYATCLKCKRTALIEDETRDEKTLCLTCIQQILGNLNLDDTLDIVARASSSVRRVEINRRVAALKAKAARV